MFFHSLTESTFSKGLKIYLSDLTFAPLGAAQPQHFYDALQRAANDSIYKVRDIFGSWEMQKGYPILYVERSYNDHRVRFTQVSQ
jgi:aminopeptidase N